MKKIIIIPVLALVILMSGSFYWLEIRPVNIRKECFKKASEEEQQMIASEMRTEASGLPITKGNPEKLKNQIFDECLLENGLKK